MNFLPRVSLAAATAAAVLLPSLALALTPTPSPTPLGGGTPGPTPTPVYQVVTPVALTASTQDGANGPARVADNDFSTRWSGLGDGAWLQVDLGRPRMVGHLQIAFYRGNERRNTFRLELSDDAVDWSNAGLHTGSGTTTALETFDIGIDRLARYVRYVGSGATNNIDGSRTLWNSVTELRVFAQPEPALPPPTPRSLRAQPSAGRVTLTWVGPNATQFRVERRLSQCDTFSPLATTASATYTDTTVVDRQRYYYRVIAVNGFGTSAPSEPLGVTPQLQPPAPTVLSVMAGGPDSGRMDLRWTAVPTATRYVIRRDVRGCFYGAPPRTLLTTVSAPATTFVDMSAVPGVSYVYAVWAANETGEGKPSNVVPITAAGTAPPGPTPTPCPAPTITPTPIPPTAPPPAPIQVTVAASHERLQVSWMAAGGYPNHATRYYVYRAMAACGPFTQVAYDVREPFVDRGIVNGTTYHYVVVGVNDFGESLDSDVVAAAPEARPPDKPTGVVAFRTSPSPGTQVTRVAWNRTFTADRYLVRRGTQSGGPYDTLGTVIHPEAFFHDFTAAPGVQYYYVVTAVNPAGETTSDERPFRFDPTGTPTPPPNPSLRVHPGGNQVQLTWLPTAGASGYRVSRRATACEPWQAISIVATPSYVDPVAIPRRFYYDVAAVFPGGSTSPYNMVGSAPFPTNATAPASFTLAVAAGPEVRLSWPAHPAATFFRLFRRTILNTSTCAAQDPFLPLATVNGTSYVDRQVSAGATFEYQLAAVVPGQETARLTDRVTIPGIFVGPTPTPIPCPIGATPTPTSTPPANVPDAPETVSAAVSNQQVRVSWTPSRDERLGYRIYRGTQACGPFAPIASDVKGTAFADTGIANGGSYHYLVTARNMNGEGPEGRSGAANPVNGPPVLIGPLRELVARPDGVFLRWKPAYTATSYTVSRRQEFVEDTYTAIGTSTSDTFLDTTARPSTRYSYYVTPVNAFGTGQGVIGDTTSAPASVEVTPPASGVTASTNDGNGPGNTVDNNLATRWSGNGDGATLTFDLGTPRTVTYVKVAVYRGNERRNAFDLLLSLDGVAWERWPTRSTGTTTQEETYDVQNQLARYVRYVGHGATNNDGSTSPWNSVTEVSIFAAVAAPPTPTPTPIRTMCPTPFPTPTQVPAPSNLTATIANDIITLHFTGSTWPRYRLMRSTSVTGPFSTRMEFTDTGREVSVIDSGDDGTRYFYYVEVFEQRVSGGPPCPHQFWTISSPPSETVSIVAGSGP